MASIVLIVIGRIDCLAYGTIFMRAMFRPKLKLDFFSPPEKPQMSAGGWWVSDVPVSVFFSQYYYLGR
jgi:hypothetical protein